MKKMELQLPAHNYEFESRQRNYERNALLQKWRRKCLFTMAITVAIPRTAAKAKGGSYFFFKLNSSATFKNLNKLIVSLGLVIVE